MSEDMIHEAAEFARKCIQGFRMNSTREAWRHPEDVASLIRKLPGLETDGQSLPLLETVAWLHDILEDGIKADGSHVCEEDLRLEGFSDRVIAAVVQLTRTDKESKPAYLERLVSAEEAVLVVKAADRICNLTEAVTTCDRDWIERYVEQTEQWIVPLLEMISSPQGPWLKERLGEVLAVCRNEVLQ